MFKNMYYFQILLVQDLFSNHTMDLKTTFDFDGPEASNELDRQEQTTSGTVFYFDDHYGQDNRSTT